MITQSGFIDLWLQLAPGQALAFMWEDDEVDGRRRSKLLIHRVAFERVMPRSDDERQHTDTWTGLEDTISSSNSFDRTFARPASTGSNPEEPEDEPDDVTPKENCRPCGKQVTNTY